MAQRGRGIAAVAAAVVALTGVFGAIGPASAADKGTGVVSAAVAPGSQTNAGGSFYAFQARPGDTITQHVVVRNVTKRVVTAKVDPVDAITADATGVAFPPAGT